MRLAVGLAGPQPWAWRALLLSMMAPASASRSPRPSRAFANGWCRAEVEVLDPRLRGGLVPSPHRVSRAAGHRAAQPGDLAYQLAPLLSRRRRPQRPQSPAAAATEATRRPGPPRAAQRKASCRRQLRAAGVARGERAVGRPRLPRRHRRRRKRAAEGCCHADATARTFPR